MFSRSTARVQCAPFATLTISCLARRLRLADPPASATQPSAEPVSDVAWSPSSATIFASATGDGRLDIWDLAQSTISPIHTDQLDGTRLSCVSFAPSSPVLVAGASNLSDTLSPVAHNRPLLDTSGPFHAHDETRA